MGIAPKSRLRLVSREISIADATLQRRIAILALPKAALSDIAGPFESFVAAAQIAQRNLNLDRPYYAVSLVSMTGSEVGTLSGLSISGACPFDRYQGIPDTLVVAGEPDSLEGATDREAFFDWLRRVASESRRVCSVCTGSFCLAEAGLLDGLKVATHWQHAEKLAQRYPVVHVDPEPLFRRDGKFYTSAGCTASMDLSLALIEEDLGAGTAAELASNALMFLRRPGRQQQISPLLKLQLSEREPLRYLQTWMLEHLHLPLTVEDLAMQVHMSPRNFARTFVATVGVTPARFLETLRLEAARRRLEETSRGLEQIAFECGFGSAEVMRRAFVRNLGVPPSAYRNEAGAAQLA